MVDRQTYWLGDFEKESRVTAECVRKELDCGTCPEATECRDASTCDGSTGQCIVGKPKTGARCDTGDPTTIGTCDVSGQCVGTSKCTGVTCAEETQCRHAGQCVAATGQCELGKVKTGWLCDDGNTHTHHDTCNAQGQCTGVSKCEGVTCPGETRCLSASRCVPTTGMCSTQQPKVGATCSDGDITTSDVCDARGLCISTPKCFGVTCPTETECLSGSQCVPETGKCSEQQPKIFASCHDPKSDPRIMSSRCDAAGKCISTSKCSGVKCSAETDCMFASECISETGQCSVPLPKTGHHCDDGLAFTVNDRCTVSGRCQGTQLCLGITCPLQTECLHSSVCDPLTGTCNAQRVKVGSRCDDRDDTTRDDKCGADGVCRGVSKCSGVVCEAPSGTRQCRVRGKCEPTTGQCPPIDSILAPPGTPCSDGLNSTVNDQCTASGHCVGVKFDDQNQVDDSSPHTTLITFGFLAAASLAIVIFGIGLLIVRRKRKGTQNSSGRVIHVIDDRQSRNILNPIFSDFDPEQGLAALFQLKNLSTNSPQFRAAKAALVGDLVDDSSMARPWSTPDHDIAEDNQSLLDIDLYADVAPAHQAQHDYAAPVDQVYPELDTPVQIFPSAPPPAPLQGSDDECGLYDEANSGYDFLDQVFTVDNSDDDEPEALPRINLKPPHPQDHCCCITGDVMIDPVVLRPCGHSVERLAIERWFESSSNRSCPECRTIIDSDPIPNIALRRAIETWQMENPERSCT